MNPTSLLEPHRNSIDQLRLAGQQFWTRGWSLGTSSNYSVVINRDPIRLLITASGKDKGNLGPTDFVIVDKSGKCDPPTQAKSSAETLLHCSAVVHQSAGAVLHTHSVWSTILSNRFAAQRGILIGGHYEPSISVVATHFRKHPGHSCSATAGRSILGREFYRTCFRVFDPSPWHVHMGKGHGSSHSPHRSHGIPARMCWSDASSALAHRFEKSRKFNFCL
jgi:Class II Aldolase and Adducin N-terminal domain